MERPSVSGSLAPSVRSQVTRSSRKSTYSEQVRKSHRRTVHIIANCDCGGTSLLVMGLVCTTLVSLLKHFDKVKKKKGQNDNEVTVMDYVLVAIQGILIFFISINICVCAQLMHHTKPDNDKLDVLRRAEFWKNYNAFLCVLLPVHMLLTFWSEDYGGGSLSTIFLVSRIAFLILIGKYIKELHRDLALIYPMHFPSDAQVVNTRSITVVPSSS